MPPYRHIVVGVDLDPKSGRVSPGSAAAIACARWLAQGREAVRCTLVYSSAADEFWNSGECAYEAVGAGAVPREALDGALRELHQAGIAAELEIAEERAWRAITRRVLEAPCDLVIIGKRSEAERDGPLIGSQAGKLLRKCPCAVWVARPGAQLPPRRLLAATDLSPVGEHVLERAAQLAERAGAELHAVHALQRNMAAQLDSNESGSQFVQRSAALASERIRDGIRAARFSGELELHVGLTSPTGAILECARRQDPDLVVMATISRGGIAGLLLGNTAERLLARLDASLLIVKPADFVCPVSLHD